jgi:hypothetical protein
MLLRVDAETLSPIPILVNIITDQASLDPERTFAVLMPK